MSKSLFYTESINGIGYDYFYIYRTTKEKSGTLYLNYKYSYDYSKSEFFDGETPTHIERKEFDSLLSEYVIDEEYDLSVYDPYAYERFYRECPNSDQLVDYIEICATKKQYVLLFGADDRVTDGYDVIHNEIFSNYVSGDVFELIIAGVKAKNFEEVEDFNDF